MHTLKKGWQKHIIYFVCFINIYNMSGSAIWIIKWPGLEVYTYLQGTPFLCTPWICPHLKTFHIGSLNYSPSVFLNRLLVPFCPIKCQYSHRTKYRHILEQPHKSQHCEKLGYHAWGSRWEEKDQKPDTKHADGKAKVQKLANDCWHGRLVCVAHSGKLPFLNF